eukprot:scaffold337076_cov38-Prasinocladus_malaysianus.AAC.1
MELDFFCSGDNEVGSSSKMTLPPGAFRTSSRQQSTSNDVPPQPTINGWALFSTRGHRAPGKRASLADFGENFKALLHSKSRVEDLEAPEELQSTFSCAPTSSMSGRGVKYASRTTSPTSSTRKMSTTPSIWTRMGGKGEPGKGEGRGIKSGKKRRTNRYHRLTRIFSCALAVEMLLVLVRVSVILARVVFDCGYEAADHHAIPDDSATCSFLLRPYLISGPFTMAQWQIRRKSI